MLKLKYETIDDMKYMNDHSISLVLACIPFNEFSLDTDVHGVFSFLSFFIIATFPLNIVRKLCTTRTFIRK